MFSSFWHGGPLSPYEQLCLSSFVRQGQNFTLYTYGPLAVPAGVELADALRISPESSIFQQKSGFGKGSFAAFADCFRLRMLELLGGWWVDVDILYLGASVPDFDYFFCCQEANAVNNAVMKAPTGSQFITELRRRVEAMGGDASWGETGPLALTRQLAGSPLQRYVAPPPVCYPIHWRDAWKLFLPETCDEVTALCSRSFTVHLWNEVIKILLPTKSRLPPRGSFLRGHMDRYRISGDDEYSALEMQELVAQFRTVVK